MYEDLDVIDNTSDTQKVQKLLRIIQDKLLEAKKSMEDFGFPFPDKTETILDRYKIRFNANEQLQKFEDLQLLKPLNDEQNVVFNDIISIINNQIANPNNDAVYIDLRGDAGTGKSLLIEDIVLYMRAREVVVIGSCSTALAAQVYPKLGFTTTHTAYDIEVFDEYDRNLADGPVECKMAQDKLEFVQLATVHIVDEAFSLHRENFEAVIRALKDARGKVFILTGDEKQCLPVVPGGKRFDIINATIFSSHLWPRFKHFRLKRNMRLETIEMNDNEKSQQIEYAKILQAIGYGETYGEQCTLFEENENEDETHLSLSNIKQFIADDGKGNSDVITNDILEWLYPGLKYDPEIAKNVTVVANTNKEIELWNKTISDLNPKKNIL
jgi:PIF1-like helicase